jgi:tetratricopeptide (TPR) repeat protein
MKTPRLVLFVIATLLFFNIKTTGQDWSYVVSGKVTSNNEQVNLEGAVVTLFKNGSQVQQMVTKRNGKYSFVLEPNHEWMLSYTKAGYCNKKIYVSTRNVPPERGAFGFATQPIDVDLFEMPTDAGLSGKINDILSDPIGKFVYVSSAQDFDFDAKYTEEIKKKLKELQKLKKEVEDKKLAESQNEVKYQDALKTGDALANQGKFQDAISQYNLALGFKPNDPVATNKISDIQKKMKDAENAKNLQAKYDAALKIADDLFKAGKFAEAKTAYQECLTIKSNEPYPKSQIELCDKKLKELEDQKNLQAKYDAAIKKGDEHFKNAAYQDAITAYNEAVGYKSAEQYPRDQIVLCQKKIKELADLKDVQAKYDAAIKKGDENFNKRDWKVSRAAYTEALQYKPNEKYPKDQLALIDKEEKLDKEKQELESKYLIALKKGDDAFKARDWKTARAGYTEALTYKPNESYPKDQIAKIDLEEKNADLEKKYTQLILLADGQFNKAEYLTAKTTYEDALKLKPGEKYPKDQLALIEKKLKELDDQKNIQAKYDAAVKKGDDQFKSGDFNAAITSYTEAKNLKPQEKYPPDQIALCQNKLKELANLKDLQAKYDAAIKKGDENFNKRDWKVSRAAYTEALSYKPAEKYPKDQLALIDKEEKLDKDKQELESKYLIALKKGDDAFKARDWKTARAGYTEALTYKPNESYPKDQISKIDIEEKNADLEKKYTQLILLADGQFNKADFVTAKTNYEDALKVKPGEKYPKDQIALIEKKLKELENQKDLQAKYDAAVKKGDDQFKSGDFNAAITSYTEAKNLKPQEKYPPDQIALCLKKIKELDDLKDVQAKYDAAIKRGDAQMGAMEYNTAKVSYEEALKYKPQEKYPKDKLAEISKLIELQKKYNEAIALGDGFFNKKDYKNAKAAYTNAVSIFDEKYPKDQIELCNKFISELENQKENEQKYAQAIKEADAFYVKKNWSDALSKYTEASGYKPSEKYPKDRINELNGILAKIKDEEDKKNREKEMNDKYLAAVAKADAFFGKKDYENAKMMYTEAGGYLPTHPYPPQMIAKCNEFIKKAELNDPILKEYNQNIVAGDKAFKEMRLEDALGFYQKASDLKPSEKYPKDKIEEVNAAIKQRNLNKEKDLVIIKYNELIKDADKLFGARNWNKAKIKYNEALALQPFETYPKDKIAQCDKFLKGDNSVTVKNNDPIVTDNGYEEARKKRYNELVKKFGGPGRYEIPEVTESNKKITEVVIITETEAYVYKKIVFNFGQIQYSKNDSPINAAEYEAAVNPQY